MTLRSDDHDGTARCVVRHAIVPNAVLAFLCGLLAGPLMIMALSRTRTGLVVWAGMAFFGGSTVLFGKRCVDRTPRLILDEAGVTDGWGVGFIPWSGLRKVSVARMGRVDAIRLHPQQPDEWWSRLPFLSRCAWRWWPDWRVINIPLQNVDVSTDDILVALRRLVPAGRVELD